MSVAPAPYEPLPPGPAVVVQGNVQGGVQHGPNGLQINNPRGAVVVDRRETRRVRRPIVSPPPAPEGFVGRLRELSQISASLVTHSAVVVVGAAGVGKSAILVRIASAQALSDFPEGIIRIAGIDRRGTGRSADDIAQCLYNAAYDADPVPKLTIETARAELAGLGVFVLLDDIALPADDQAEVAGLFQAGRTILAATRTTLDSTVEPVRLSALQRDESMSLLFGRAGVTASAGDPDLDRICALLADWPEALVIAANAMRDQALGPHDARLAIESTLTSSEEPVVAALERAFALAEPALTSDERRTLSTAASLPGGSVDPSMLRALLGHHDWVEPAIEHLRALGLLFTNSPRLRVHPALLALATVGFDDAPVQKAHVDALRTWLGRHEPASEEVGDELDSVLGALDRAFEDKRWQEVIDLGRAIDPYVALRGQWDVWGRVIDWVGEASAELGASADLAWSLHQAGSRALMLGHAAAAEKALLAALSIREQSGDVVGAAYTRHNLNRLRGGPPPGERTPQPKPDGRHRPWARALWIATVAVVIVGSSVVGAFGLGIIGASDRTSPPQPTEAPIPTPTETPTPLVAAIAVPPGIEFGSVEVPGTATQDMIIVNSGTLPIAVRALDPGGNQPNEFAVAPGTCLSRLIQPNDSCRASITFRPARAGLRDADLVVSTDQLAPTTVHLAGFGVETGELKLDPPAMQFDAISSEPLPQTATIVATGPLTVVGLPVEGSYASEFSVVQDDCVDVHLMARQGCRIMVQYTPPSESWVDLAPDRDATLVIRTASGTAWTITLLAHLTVPVLTASGTLVFGVAIGSTSITVTVTSSCGFQVTGGVNGQLIWGNVADNVTIYEVSQYAAGQQTLQVSALTLPHDFGESASQTIADCQ